VGQIKRHFQSLILTFLAGLEKKPRFLKKVFRFIGFYGNFLGFNVQKPDTKL